MLEIDKQAITNIEALEILGKNLGKILSNLERIEKTGKMQK